MVLIVVVGGMVRCDVSSFLRITIPEFISSNSSGCACASIESGPSTIIISSLILRAISRCFGSERQSIRRLPIMFADVKIYILTLSNDICYKSSN